jgi:hypothetical protein
LPAASVFRSTDGTLETVRFVVEAYTLLIIVELAYGNCDAATVDDEKKTPCVKSEVVVAAVEVPKAFLLLKRYVKLPLAHDCAYTEPEAFIVRHCPAEVERFVMASDVEVAFVEVEFCVVRLWIVEEPIP